MNPGPLATADAAVLKEDEGGTFAARPRRSCRDKKPSRFTYEFAGQTHDDFFGFGEDGLDEDLAQDKRRSRKRRKGKRGDVDHHDGITGVVGEGTGVVGEIPAAASTQPTFEVLDEETALLHRCHLSPSLGKSEVANLWEFASVLDFYGHFGKEVNGKCLECVQRHLIREAELWGEEFVTVYDDNRIFESIFFTSKQLAQALELSPDSEDPHLLADIHIMLLKSLHPRSMNPPCRLNWLIFVRDKVAKKWPKISAGAAPPPAFTEEGLLSLWGRGVEMEGNDDPQGDSKGGNVDKAEEGEAAEDPLLTAYKKMSPHERLQGLRFLCELCCDSQQISKRIEKSVIHSSLAKKAKDMVAEMKVGDPPVEVTLPGGRKIKLAGDLEFVEDMRTDQAFALDIYGRKYWLVNFYPEQGHCFLIRESLLPATIPASAEAEDSPGGTNLAAPNNQGKTKSRRGSAKKPVAQQRHQVHDFATFAEPPAPLYEVICSDGEEFLKFVDVHVNEALFSGDVVRQFLEGEVYESIVLHKQQVEKIRLAQEKLKSQLGMAMMMSSPPFGGALSLQQDEAGGARRSRRRTKAVSYAEMEAEFDLQIEEACEAHQTKEIPEMRLGSRRSARMGIREWTDDEEDAGGYRENAGPGSDKGDSDYKDDGDDEDEDDHDDGDDDDEEEAPARIASPAPARIPSPAPAPAPARLGVFSLSPMGVRSVSPTRVRSPPPLLYSPHHSSFASQQDKGQVSGDGEGNKVPLYNQNHSPFGSSVEQGPGEGDEGEGEVKMVMDGRAIVMVDTMGDEDSEYDPIEESDHDRSSEEIRRPRGRQLQCRPRLSSPDEDGWRAW